MSAHLTLENISGISHVQAINNKRTRNFLVQYSRRCKPKVVSVCSRFAKHCIIPVMLHLLSVAEGDILYI